MLPEEVTSILSQEVQVFLLTRGALINKFSSIAFLMLLFAYYILE
jgi:hypothetical protein